MDRARTMISAMKKLLAIAVPVILSLTFSPQLTYGQITAINIAQGKKIEATSTCGVGVGEKELFCKLATVPGKFAISGLSCDYCDPLTPSSNHSIEYAIDGTENWWQSPPLSRGLQYQQVNITIDLRQVGVFTVFMPIAICYYPQSSSFSVTELWFAAVKRQFVLYNWSTWSANCTIHNLVSRYVWILSQRCRISLLENQHFRSHSLGHGHKYLAKIFQKEAKTVSLKREP